MKFFDLYNLYTNQLINQTIENIINNSQNELSNDEIFLNAKSNQKFLSIIYNCSKNINSSNFKPNVRFSPTKININDFFYLYNFILISENTIKSFLNNNYSKEIYYYYYFGECKIFAYIKGSNQYLIEIYYLDQNQGNILPEAFFKFKGEKDLNDTLFLLKEKGYEIGYAYKYNSYIKDYTPYIINNEYKTMIKLFFHYIKLHSKSIMYKSGSYFLLINSKYIKKYKEYYEYLKIETDLSLNKIVLQLIKNINESYEYNVDDKQLTLIIKNLSKEYNQKFVNKSKSKLQTNGINEEPNLKEVQNSEIYYYDDFELIDKDLA